MSRQIITKEHVQEALSEGRNELHLGARDIITSVALEAAEQQGMRIIRTDEPERTPQPTAASPGAAPGPTQTPPSPVHEGSPTAPEIKKAVINQLGQEPDGLDAIIAKVLKG